MHQFVTAAALAAGDVAILGLPTDEHSSLLRGPAFAPNRIREAFNSGSSNMWTEHGIDLEAAPHWHDLGDLAIAAGANSRSVIEAGAKEVLARGARLISLGGDHAITYPLLRAYGPAYPGLTILHIDAHPDLYDELDGDRFSHACPFARIMEAGLAARLVQVGIRTLNAHQHEQAKRFGVEMIQMRDWQPGMDLGLHGPLYLSLDLDGLDPAFAPGVSHHEPGGLSTREVIGLIQGLPGPLVGADIVEYNPLRDPSGITAALAAKLLKEILARML